MRIEFDTLGEVRVPDTALWGAQTQRAVENFTISGIRFERRFIHALGWVKYACARANMELGELDDRLGEVILQACDEVIAGELDEHFPVDIFQTGSGTSTNMNMNEVIANRALQLLGGIIGSKHPIHPNDHVNMSQSSNDVIPTAIHIATTLALRDDLLPTLKTMHTALVERAQAFDGIVKSGRTHLQDATPIRLGQEFSGYATQVRKDIRRVQQGITLLAPLPLGGTAVGTGLNCPPGFPARAIAHLNEALNVPDDTASTGWTPPPFTEARDHIEANASRANLVEVSGHLKTIAVSIHKIANDVRWLGSGPRNGLGELQLPAVQPGSSIMPGKVNPVMAEALIMVCAQVIGYDAAITLCGLGSAFEINTMQPLIAHNLLNSIKVLTNAVQAFTTRCIIELQANADHCERSVEHNLSLATALAPVIGYDKAAKIAKEAHRTGQTVRQVAMAWEVLEPEKLDLLLDPYRMTTSFPPSRDNEETF
jgi:fumarate hydratase, class II